MAPFISVIPDIPERWRPAYRDYQQALERQYAITGAWILLFTMLVYQFSHEFRNVQPPELWSVEQLIRIPVYLSIAATLLWYYSGKPGYSPKPFLRAMSLSLMAMLFTLFFVYFESKRMSLHQITDGLTITAFGVSLMATRGLRDWSLQFLLPIVLFIIAAYLLRMPLAGLGPYLFAPAVMMMAGLAVSEALRRMGVQQFLATQRMEELATTDQLTGLLNRRAMHDIMERELSRASRNNHTFALILGDLDLFKRVNDTYGHDIGDEVLRETARRLGSQMRAQDALCRWGGEELLILLPETDMTGAMQAAEKLRCVIADTPMAVGSHQIPQTISLGVACWHREDELDRVIRRADEGLYLAKDNGRNRVATIEEDPTGKSGGG